VSSEVGFEFLGCVLEVGGHEQDAALAEPRGGASGTAGPGTDQLREGLLILGDEDLFAGGKLGEDFPQPGLRLFHGDAGRHLSSSREQAPFDPPRDGRLSALLVSERSVPWTWAPAPPSLASG